MRLELNGTSAGRPEHTDIINDCGPEKADVIEPERLAYRAVTPNWGFG
jgi:hypothetical protein